MSGDVTVQPPTTLVLLAQRELLCSSVVDPVDDDLLQMMDVITSGVVGSSVKLYRHVRTSMMI